MFSQKQKCNIFLVGQGPLYQNFEETYFVASFTNTFTTL